MKSSKIQANAIGVRLYVAEAVQSCHVSVRGNLVRKGTFTATWILASKLILLVG